MAKSISIRVNCSKPSDSVEKPAEIIVYHWDRIFFALTVLFIFIAGIVYGLNRFMTSNPMHEVTKPLAQEIPQSVLIDPPVEKKPVVLVMSQAIKRAQLTHDLIDKEPTDSLEARILLKPKTGLELYFFTEISGFKHRLIYHDWYWKGKRVERNKISIDHKLQKTASARLIHPDQTGEWKILVLDANDQVLAKASFETLRHE